MASLTEIKPQTMQQLRALSLAAPFPCWPDQPRYVVFLTRDVDRWVTRLARLNLVIWPILFLFQAQVDTLWTAVFGKGTISHFAFIRDQYEYLVASQKIEHFDPSRHPALADFHMLEIATWLAIALCATRLITGIAFLRQFDARYVILSRHFATKFFPLLIIWLAWGMYLITDLPLQTKTSYAVPMMAYVPKVYWALVAMLYVGGLYAMVQLLHFVTWQMFRQKWPWATLWHPNIQSNGFSARSPG
jgi:hypothetical protein